VQTRVEARVILSKGDKPEHWNKTHRPEHMTDNNTTHKFKESDEWPEHHSNKTHRPKHITENNATHKVKKSDEQALAGPFFLP
jgi:hypothetical protein